MSKYWKTGLLIFLLIGPVLFFLFLKLFGTNRFDIPRYYPVVDSLSGVVRVVNGDTVFQQVAGWNLIDTASRNVDEAQLNDRFSLVYVPDSLGSYDSRAALVVMDRVEAGLDSIPELQFLLVTASEKKLIAGELAEVGYKGPIGILGGTNASIEEVRNSVFKGKRAESGFEPNSFLVLIDNTRVIRGYFDLRKETEFERLQAEVRILKYNK